MFIVDGLDMDMKLKKDFIIVFKLGHVLFKFVNFPNFHVYMVYKPSDISLTD